MKLGKLDLMLRGESVFKRSESKGERRWGFKEITYVVIVIVIIILDNCDYELMLFIKGYGMYRGKGGFKEKEKRLRLIKGYLFVGLNIRHGDCDNIFSYKNISELDWKNRALEVRIE